MSGKKPSTNLECDLVCLAEVIPNVESRVQLQQGYSQFVPNRHGDKVCPLCGTACSNPLRLTFEEHVVALYCVEISKRDHTSLSRYEMDEVVVKQTKSYTIMYASKGMQVPVMYASSYSDPEKKIEFKDVTGTVDRLVRHRNKYWVILKTSFLENRYNEFRMDRGPLVFTSDHNKDIIVPKQMVKYSNDILYNHLERVEVWYTTMVLNVVGHNATPPHQGARISFCNCTSDSFPFICRRHCPTVLVTDAPTNRDIVRHGMGGMLWRLRVQFERRYRGYCQGGDRVIPCNRDAECAGTQTCDDSISPPNPRKETYERIVNLNLQDTVPIKMIDEGIQVVTLRSTQTQPAIVVQNNSLDEAVLDGRMYLDIDTVSYKNHHLKMAKGMGGGIRINEQIITMCFYNPDTVESVQEMRINSMQPAHEFLREHEVSANPYRVRLYRVTMQTGQVFGLVLCHMYTHWDKGTHNVSSLLQRRALKWLVDKQLLDVLCGDNFASALKPTQTTTHADKQKLMKYPMSALTRTTSFDRKKQKRMAASATNQQNRYDIIMNREKRLTCFPGNPSKIPVSYTPYQIELNTPMYSVRINTSVPYTAIYRASQTSNRVIKIGYIESYDAVTKTLRVQVLTRSPNDALAKLFYGGDGIRVATVPTTGAYNKSDTRLLCTVKDVKHAFQVQAADHVLLNECGSGVPKMGFLGSDHPLLVQDFTFDRNVWYDRFEQSYKDATEYHGTALPQTDVRSDADLVDYGKKIHKENIEDWLIRQSSMGDSSTPTSEFTFTDHEPVVIPPKPYDRNGTVRIVWHNVQNRPLNRLRDYLQTLIRRFTM